MESFSEESRPSGSAGNTTSNDSQSTRTDAPPIALPAEFGRFVRITMMMRSWVNLYRKSRVSPTTQARVDSFLDKYGLARKADNMRGSGAYPGDSIASTSEKTNRQSAFSCCFFVIDPSSDFYYRWLAVVSAVVLYNLVVLITRSAYTKVQENYSRLWIAVDYLSDFVYAADIAVRFSTGYLEHGILVREFSKLRANYLRSADFRLAILSIVPTDLLYLVPPATVNRPFVRFNRLFKVDRLREFFRKLDSRAVVPYVYRGSSLVLSILIAIHWNACFYIHISRWIGFGSDEWVYNMTSDDDDVDVIGTYVFSFYWSTLMLTSIGDVSPPKNDVECVVMIANFFAAVLIFATIVGNLSDMIGEMRRSRTDFDARMDSVKRYMALRRVGKEFERRIVGWFDYIWLTGQSVADDQRTLSVLPDNLRTELAINVHLEVLRRVSLFRDCDSPGLLAKLVGRLGSVVYSPGDYVCRRGDVGKEMYIVKSGLLSVLADDGQTPLATVTGGGFFGEVSLLDIPGNSTGNRRVADVKSIGFSDIFTLSKEDLWNTLEEYPEAKQKLIEAGEERLRLSNMYDEGKAAAAAAATAAGRGKVITSLEHRIDSLNDDLDFLLEHFQDWLTSYRKKEELLFKRITKLNKQRTDGHGSVF